MSKWFEISVTINKTFAVEANNKEDAIEGAMEEGCFGGDMTIDDISEPITEKNSINIMKICADEIINYVVK